MASPGVTIDVPDFCVLFTGRAAVGSSIGVSSSE